jgi:HTH-type transcriptional regulator / antitoxin HipB
MRSAETLSVIADATRRRRRALRLTQIALAELAGVGADFVYDVEKGKPTLRLDKLLDVLEVLGLQLRIESGKKRLVVARELAPEGTEK